MSKNVLLDVGKHPVDSFRDAKGQLIAPIPGTEKYQITPATSREMQRKSAEARRNRAMREAQNRTLRELAAIEPTVTSWAAAWGELVARQAVALMDSDKPRGDDLLRIGQALGAVPLSGEKEQPSTGEGTISALSELVREIAEAARTIRQADVIDMRSENDVIDNK